MRYPSSYPQQQPVSGPSIRPSVGPQSTKDNGQTQGDSSYPVGMSDEPLQFTGRMPAPRIQGPSYPPRQPLLGPGIRPSVIPLPTKDNVQTQGDSSYPVGMSDEPLQFAGRMPAPRIQGPSYPLSLIHI